MKNKIDKQSIKDIALIGLGAYAVVSMGYIALVLSGGDDPTKMYMSHFGLRLLYLLVYSLIIGASFMLFKVKKTENGVSIGMRLLHILVTYLSTVVLMLLLIDSKANPAQKLVYIVITTIVFAAVYGVVCLFAYLIKKKKA